MTAPPTPSPRPSDTPQAELLHAALRALNVTITYGPLPGPAAATWHGLTLTLTLARAATQAEHLEVMTDLWERAHGLPTRDWARPRRRHLHAVP
jgi:hypothetical protein